MLTLKDFTNFVFAMEENKISHEESLRIITEMIETSRSRMERKYAYPFIIWGTATVIIAIVISIMIFNTQNTVWYYLWWALPIVGSSSFLFTRKDKVSSPKTYIEKVSSKMWLILAIIAIVLSFISTFSPIFGRAILTIIALFMGLGTLMSGLLYRYRTIQIYAYIGIALSIAMMFFEPYFQLLIFALIFMIMMVIPGLIILHRFKK